MASGSLAFRPPLWSTAPCTSLLNRGGVTAPPSRHGAFARLRMSGSAEGFVGQEDIEVYDVNMDGTGRGRLTWDRDAGRYRKRRGAAGDDKTSEGLKVVENEFMQHRVGGSTGMGGKVANLLRNIRMSFLPRGVSEDYYAFTVWRIAQRIVSSTVSVFGTQSLLLALGVKTHKVGAAAASGWVIANAIGKFAKMSFAAGWGRDFDSDAKRWRFRAALMWIVANGMEIVVYVVHNNFPRSFVFLVALSVSLKQISILTSSATRGTFYKQFAGQNENLGDITAKGDAQVAIADLLGMVVGIQLARLAGSTALYIWGAWMILSAADFICILKSLDTIIFKFLNLERASLIAHSFVNGGKVPAPAELALVEPILSRPRRAVPQGNLLTGWYWDVVRGYWAGTFRKISETTVTPIELKMLLRVFANGQYMVLHSRHPKMSEAPPRPCLVLRQSATEDDVLEAMLALEHLRESIEALPVERRRALDTEPANALPLIEKARDSARKGVERLVRGVEESGWSLKSSGKPTLMVGYIRQRAIW